MTGVRGQSIPDPIHNGFMPKINQSNEALVRQEGLWRFTASAQFENAKTVCSSVYYYMQIIFGLSVSHIKMSPNGLCYVTVVRVKEK